MATPPCHRKRRLFQRLRGLPKHLCSQKDLNLREKVLSRSLDNLLLITTGVGISGRALSLTSLSQSQQEVEHSKINVSNISESESDCHTPPPQEYNDSDESDTSVSSAGRLNSWKNLSSSRVLFDRSPSTSELDSDYENSVAGCSSTVLGTHNQRLHHEEDYLLSEKV